MAPKSITRPKSYLLKADWSDGFSAVVKLEAFREACPCAECNEKRQNKPKDKFNMLKSFAPGKYDLKALNPVGNYAVEAEWNDGHNTGIYDWKFFRDVFEKNALTDEMIKQLEAKYN